jgi:hypothetical protein
MIAAHGCGEPVAGEGKSRVELEVPLGALTRDLDQILCLGGARCSFPPTFISSQHPKKLSYSTFNAMASTSALAATSREGQDYFGLTTHDIV